MKTLWLYRPVLSWRNIYEWGAAQGMKKFIPPHELHATLATCRQPVDWSDLVLQDDVLEIDAGDYPVQIFGFMAKGIAFASPVVLKRHRALAEMFPSMDHPTALRPHVTIMRGGKMPKADYNGPLIFGPEVAAEFSEEAARSVKHVKITEVLGEE